METIKLANKIIKDGITLLPDEMKSDFKAQTGEIFINEAIANAMAMVNKDAEKEALLKAWAVQEANRLVSALWREELLTAELEKDYRTLPKMKEVADYYNENFVKPRQERMNETMAKHKEITDEEKELDIFKGVVNGMSAKEAERKYEEYKKQVAAATQGR